MPPPQKSFIASPSIGKKKKGQEVAQTGKKAPSNLFKIKWGKLDENSGACQALVTERKVIWKATGFPKLGLNRFTEA